MPFERSFRFGDAVLHLSTNDDALARRFIDVYGDCEVDDPALPTLHCSISASPDQQLARVSFDQPLHDVARFILFVFPERAYGHGPITDDGWTTLTGDGVPFAAVSPDGTVLIAMTAGWQSFAANVAVNLVLRRQHEMLFFHGAVCSVGGRGVMLSGAKASGKTTTSVAMAQRGHALLGDEVAAIRRDTWEAVPFRRALSIRDGIRAAGVDAALAGASGATEIFPDGQARIRVHASELFAETPQAVPLHAAFFLRRFADAARIEAIVRMPRSLALLQPLGCTLWNNDGHNPERSSTMDLLRFFERTQCYYLDPGPPDQTAAAIERILGE